MEIKPFKIRDLTPEKSKIVQETLFKNGYKWANSSVSIQFLNSKHLILRNNQLYQGNNNDVFDYGEYRNIPELTFEEFERMYIKEEFVLPENWYVIVTKENRNILSKWRYEKDNVLLPIHFITGMCKNDNGKVTKEHNGINFIKGDTYDFGKEITFDQFKKYILKEDVKEEGMDKDELLKEAKRRYPVGTKYYLAHDPSKTGIITKNEFKWGTSNNIYGTNWKSGSANDGCVYNDGKWAEIVEDIKDYGATDIPIGVKEVIPEYKYELLQFESHSKNKSTEFKLLVPLERKVQSPEVKRKVEIKINKINHLKVK